MCVRARECEARERMYVDLRAHVCLRVYAYLHPLHNFVLRNNVYKAKYKISDCVLNLFLNSNSTVTLVY